MSNNCYYDYYNYLQYIKNAKVPPIYLNENGYVFTTAPLDFSHNIMSLRIKSPITIDNYSLALDLSANYHFTGSDFRVDASNIYMPKLQNISGNYVIVYDNSTGKLSYNSLTSVAGITQVLSGTNIDVEHGNTIPVVNLRITSPVDCSGQTLYDVSQVDFLSNISIRTTGGASPYISTNLGDLWLNTNNGILYINAPTINCLSGIIQNVRTLYSQNINTQDISAHIISSLSSELILKSGTSSNRILIDNSGVAMNGKSFVIDASSIVIHASSSMVIDSSSMVIDSSSIVIDSSSIVIDSSSIVIDSSSIVIYASSSIVIDASSSIVIDTSSIVIDTSSIVIDASYINMNGSSLNMSGTSLNMSGTSLNMSGSTITLDGSTINIGNPTSLINMYGTVNKIETTNVEIYDQLITLNKNGTNMTSFGSGFEIEASGGIVGYIKTDTTNGSSFLVKVPNRSTIYKMVLMDPSGYIDISGINGSSLSIAGTTHIGGAFDVSGATVLSGTANIVGATSITGNAHVGGAFDVSGAASIAGSASITGNAHVGGAFDVSGAASIAGSTSIAGSASITGNTHVGGVFDVSGAASIGGSTSIAGSTSITGNTHVGGAFDVSGATVLSGTANIGGATSITGNTHVGGAFDVSGAAVINGAASITGNTHVGGAFDVSGGAIINGTVKFNSLANINKTTLLNIDPVTDIISYETHPTYTQPLSSDVNNVISISQASASTNGYLASGDWVNFNTLLSNISATAPLTFLNNVINISNVDLSGTNGYLSSTQYQNITNSIAVAGGTAIAQVYYVGMNGNDTSGNGSVMSPFATIQKAINLCTDSTKYYTIYVAPYAYTESPTIGASISPRISIIGLTNNTNSKTVTITGSFTIAATTATGNETNNVIAFKNLTIQAATGNAINLTGQGFSLFVNNTNIAVTGSNTSSVLNLASTSKTTRYYFDNVRLNNVAVASTNHMVNLVAGQIWSITNSDFTNANTGGSVIYSYDVSGQLLAVANSSFTNTIYGNVFTIQSNPSSCSISNTTLIGYNTDASAGLLVLGNGVAPGSGGNFSVANSIIYNTNSSTSANTYVFLNGGATFISSSNSFYSPNVGVTAFTPFGFKVTKTNNIVRYTNSAYFSGNVAGTNTVVYPSVSAGIIVVENMLNDTNNLTNFNNASIRFTGIPVTTDASLVTFNPTTKQIGYRSIPTASAGSNIGIVSVSGSPTISVAITSTLDLSNQGIIGISYERFAGEINIQNAAASQIIYTTGNTANLILNPSGGVINTTGHNIDLSNASLVGISSEIFNTNMNIQVSGVATPIIYTTGTATDLLLNPSGGVINTTSHNIDMSSASIVNVNTVSGTNPTISGVNSILLQTNSITRMALSTTTASLYLPLDMSNNQVTNVSSVNYNNDISIQQNGVPRIYTSENNLIIDPSTNGALQFAGARTFDLCGGRISTATSMTGVTDTSMSIQYLGATSGALYLQSATTATNKRMVLDNSGIHVSGTGVFDISGITSVVVMDASGNLNMGSGNGSAYKFTVAGQTGNMYVGGTMDVSGVTTISLSGGNKLVVDTTGTHSNGGILDASGSLYKNTLSDASGNMYINGVAQFANEVDICANTIKMNLPDGSSNTYYVSYNLPTKQLGYKKNVTASSPLVLDGNNNLTYDFTANTTYNNATTQINSTSLIGLSGGIIDICGSTAVNISGGTVNISGGTINISGPTNMNGSIISAVTTNNVWNGPNYFAGDVSFNSANLYFGGITQTVQTNILSYDSSTKKVYYMPSSSLSILGSDNVFTGKNTFTNDVSLNGVQIYFSNIPSSSDTYFIRYNLASKQISYSLVSSLSILGLNNIFSGTNTFTSDVSLNGANLYFGAIPSSSDTYFIRYNLTSKQISYSLISSLSILGTSNTFTGTNNFQNDVYVTSTGNLTVGNSSGIGKFNCIYPSYQAYNVSAWTSNFALFSASAPSTTASALGFCQVSSSENYILSLQPTSGWTNLTVASNTFNLRYAGSGANTASFGNFITNWYGNGSGNSLGYLASWDITSLIYVLYRSSAGTTYGYFDSSTGTWGSTSDSRVKKNVQSIDLNKSKEFILSITPVTFQLKDDNITSKNIGFIAQDILLNAKTESQKNIVANWKKYEDALAIGEEPMEEYDDENDKDVSGNSKKKWRKLYLGVSATSMIPEIIGSIQKMNTENELLKTQVSDQQTNIATLTGQVDTLTTQNATLTAQVASLMSDMLTLKQMFNF